MYIIPDTELILTTAKKIYHLNLSKEEIAHDIILVGDPNRVSLISDKFDNISYKVKNREFITHTGTLNNKKISVISTGIGPDNIDIVINELDALANINFENRTINKKKIKLNLIRLGTSGALQKNIKVDTFIASSYALGFDGLAHFYKEKNILEQDMAQKYITHSNWPKDLAEPYFIKASKHLLDKFSELEQGITATAPGFYGPQGRTLRLNTKINHLQEKMTSFRYKKGKICNFEMETSALYYLGRSLGHNTLTVCAVIGNRLSKEYSSNYKETMERMINLVLKKITC